MVLVFFAADLQNRRRHHSGIVQELIQGEKFVFCMHVIVPAGVFHAEGYTAGNIMNIGAAADCNAFAGSAGLCFVDLEQCLYQGRLFRGMVGVTLNQRRAGKSGCGKGRLYLLQYGFLCGTDREADIHASGADTAFHMQHAANTGERAGFCIRAGNTQAAAVCAAVGEEPDKCRTVCKGAVLAQIGQQAGNGVVTAFRRGGVGRNALVSDFVVVPGKI